MIASQSLVTSLTLTLASSSRGSATRIGVTDALIRRPSAGRDREYSFSLWVCRPSVSRGANDAPGSELDQRRWGTLGSET